MADCVFPEDIMISILIRVPLKSIVRFKSVCKPWLLLLSSSSFKKLRLDRFSSDPRNLSLIIHKRRMTFSIIKIGHNELKPMIPYHRFDHKQFEVDFVGYCNGLVCFTVPLYPKLFCLWNPMLSKSFTKTFSPLDGYYGYNEQVSYGFGYDAVGGDFKVVRIICTESHGGTYIEVYSVNSDSWIYIRPDSSFASYDSLTKIELIVNGNPYWVSTVYYVYDKPSKALVYFDVTELVLKVVPFSDDLRSRDVNAKIRLIDYNGCVGALKLTKAKECVDVWVFDDSERVWRKDRTCGPIEVNVDHIWQWTKDGKIIGQRTDGQLFVFDPETGCVEELLYGGQQLHFDGLQLYTENLTHIEGMQPAVAKMMMMPTLEDIVDQDFRDSHMY